VRPLPLLGVLLVVVALTGYWSVYSATTGRTPVLVAAHAPGIARILVRTAKIRAGKEEAN
jgi:hypothetical protein